jgi:hypothetical protein
MSDLEFTGISLQTIHRKQFTGEESTAEQYIAATIQRRSGHRIKPILDITEFAAELIHRKQLTSQQNNSPQTILHK